MRPPSLLRSRGLFGVLMLALVLRLAAAGYWQLQVEASGETLRFGDSHTYWTIASNWAHEGLYQYGSEHSKIFRAPLYPLWIAPWTLLSDGQPSALGVMMIRILGCLLGTGAVACIHYATRQIAGERAALVAGVLASIYPGAIAMSIFVLSEAIATPLFLLSCTLLLVGLRAGTATTASTPTDASVDRGFVWPGGYWMFGSGVALGFACLARPSWCLWPACVLPYLWLASKPVFAFSWQRLVWGGAFLTGVTLVMLPWWGRNYAITGKWVPTTLQVGASLYDGWHPGASGSSDENMAFVDGFLAEQRAEDEMLAKQGLPLESTLEWRIDRRMREAAIAWAWKNPSDAAWLSLVKFWKTWSPFPVAREISPWVRWSEAMAYVGMVLGAAFGAWTMRSVRGAWWVWMPCLYLAMLHAVFIGSVRYRQPGVMFLGALAGVGCAAIIEWIRTGGHRTIEPQHEEQ